MVGKAGKLFFNFFSKINPSNASCKRRTALLLLCLNYAFYPLMVWKYTHCSIRNITQPDFVCPVCQCFKKFALIRQKSYCLKNISDLCKKKTLVLVKPGHKAICRTKAFAFN